MTVLICNSFIRATAQRKPLIRVNVPGVAPLHTLARFRSTGSPGRRLCIPLPNIQFVIRRGLPSWKDERKNPMDTGLETKYTPYYSPSQSDHYIVVWAAGRQPTYVGDAAGITTYPLIIRKPNSSWLDPGESVLAYTDVDQIQSLPTSQGSEQIPVVPRYSQQRSIIFTNTCHDEGQLLRRSSPKKS